MPVNTPSAAYEAAKPKWKRVLDCFGGRDSVIAAGEEHLPKPAALTKGYAGYQTRAHFFNAVKRTVAGLVGMIFQKPPTTENAESLKAILEDITPRGHVHFAQFAQRVARDIWKTGRVGILVDMAKDGSRPYAVIYCAADILSWRTDTNGADEVLTRVVLAESREQQDPKDEFVTEQIPRCRVLRLGLGAEGGMNVYTQTLYEQDKDNKEKWVQVGEVIIPKRRGVTLDYIPFAIVGPTGVGPDVEDPPLLDLADANLGHYRNSAELEQGLYMVALPTPWVAGTKTPDGSALPLGPEHVLELELQGSAGMLEYTGTGIKDIRQAMSDKKEEMAQLGARLIDTQTDQAETATAVRLRHSGEQATVGTVAESLEQALTQVLRWLGWWIGLEAKPSDVKASVSLNKEFFALKATAEDVKALVLALQAGTISYATFYAQLQAGGWARDGITAEEEKAEIDREAPKVEPEPAGGEPKTKTVDIERDGQPTVRARLKVAA